MRLLVAFQTSDGSDFPTLAALKGLRSTQILEPGPQFGGFKWYLEEPVLAEDHAIFFNGVGFIPLWALYREKLTPECRELLARMMKDMLVYAKRVVDERKPYFPNEYLGYLLCAWFPAAWFGSPADAEEIAEILEQTADDWLKDGWGWGEHLSNIYGNVLLDELSLLLLFGDTLPASVRAKLLRLFHDLLRLEDHFEGGFPLMPSAEHNRWGLSWQSFPACFWHVNGAWGYTQWETVENGVRRCHPAEEIDPLSEIPLLRRA
jgi:hypothetical protein